MKTVLLLSSCDAWHSYQSFRIVGVFSTMQTLVQYLKKYDSLSRQDMEQLSTIRQTQGSQINYFVEEMEINPKFEAC